MEKNLDVPIILTIFAQFVGIAVFIWRTAIRYSELKTKIDRNREDINNASTSIRARTEDTDNLLQMQISHIQEHLTTRDGYHPPTLQNWKKKWSN